MLQTRLQKNHSDDSMAIHSKWRDVLEEVRKLATQGQFGFALESGAWAYDKYHLPKKIL